MIDAPRVSASTGEGSGAPNDFYQEVRQRQNKVKIIHQFDTQLEFEIFMMRWNRGASNIGNQLTHLETKLMGFEDDVLAKITAEDTQLDSLLVLFGQLKASQADPAKRAQILALIDGDKTKITAAINANTTAPPVVIPTPAPVPAPEPTTTEPVIP
jgi:hypothetical protein